MVKMTLLEGWLSGLHIPSPGGPVGPDTEAGGGEVAVEPHRLGAPAPASFFNCKNLSCPSPNNWGRGGRPPQLATDKELP